MKTVGIMLFSHVEFTSFVFQINVLKIDYLDIYWKYVPSSDSGQIRLT